MSIFACVCMFVCVCSESQNTRKKLQKKYNRKLVKGRYGRLYDYIAKKKK